MIWFGPLVCRFLLFPSGSLRSILVNLATGTAWEYNAADSNLRNTIVKKTDKISPRAWLESLPNGAYTVIRCDRISKEDEWIIWGEEFHCCRLEESFRLLFVDQTHADVSAVSLRNDAKKALHYLLNQALMKSSIADPEFMGQVYMVTLLAYPSTRGDSSTKTWTLKGHISPGPPIRHPLLPLATGIQAAIDSPGLPTYRRDNPMAKNSAWCTQRRPLETAAGADEVFLLDNSDVLEGLTSNIFVVDSTGILHTSGDRILHGYVRDRVLKLHPSVRQEAPDLKQIDTWKQVFCTSALRLVVPVQSIVNASSGEETELLWKSSADTSFVENLYKDLVREQYKYAGRGSLCQSPPHG